MSHVCAALFVRLTGQPGEAPFFDDHMRERMLAVDARSNWPANERRDHHFKTGCMRGGYNRGERDLGVLASRCGCIAKTLASLADLPDQTEYRAATRPPAPGASAPEMSAATSEKLAACMK